MKKIISMIGLGAALFLVPACKKSEVKPQESSYQSTQKDPRTMSSLFVSLSSKSCDVKSKEYSAVTLDIRTVRVFYENSGWVDLRTNSGPLNLVGLQGASEPANLTEKIIVPLGIISKIAVVMGPENRLVVGDRPASCFNLAAKEVIVDVKADVRASTLNQIILGVDICGNIFANYTSSGETCYTLKPMITLQSFKSMPVLSSSIDEEEVLP